jgi:hypothetical protein
MTPEDGALTTPTGAAYPIPLEPGWNQFGNPFAFAVAWDCVSVSNPGQVGLPHGFDQTLGTIGDYPPDPPRVLVPFEGYFIKNSSMEPETLWVPPVEAPDTMLVANEATSGVRHAANPAATSTTDSWQLRLRARTEQALDAGITLGIHPDALEEVDPMDREKPPSPPGPWVSLALANHDWEQRPGLYRRDLRPPGSEGHTWSVEIRSAEAGEMVWVERRTDSSVPGEVFFRLIDLEQDVSVDPRQTPVSESGYRLLSFGPDEPYRLVVLIGSESFVERGGSELVETPATLMLSQNAPNPFHKSTVIRFGLPRAAQVDLKIYDITGALPAVAPGASSGLPHCDLGCKKQQRTRGGQWFVFLPRDN